jgi:hypothetical protein
MSQYEVFSNPNLLSYLANTCAIHYALSRKVKCLVTFAPPVMRMVAHGAVFIELDQRKDGWKGVVLSCIGFLNLIAVSVGARVVVGGGEGLYGRPPGGWCGPPYRDLYPFS